MSTADTINTESTAVEILTSSDKFLIKLGLERVSRVLDYLNNPEDQLKIVHVAGTNGKGSVCSILSNILASSGLLTGLFTSPHLFSYCERIKVNGEEILEKELNKYVAFVCSSAEDCGVELTEFEILTVAGFCYFKDRKVDIVVLETGLGGRFDATNVINNPILSIITSISLDHTQRLGNTINKIAFEKAGIIKTSTPVIVSPENAGYRTILEQAAQKGSVILPLPKCSLKSGHAVYRGNIYKFPLLGSHQEENLALALCAAEFLNVPESAFEKGIEGVSHKFRMEYRKEQNLLIDACHNPDGARVLRMFLNEKFENKPVRFIFGCLDNKNYEAMLQILVRPQDELFFYKFNNSNALQFEDLPERFRKKACPITIAHNQIGGKKLTVVCGSIYMLGEIFKSEL